MVNGSISDWIKEGLKKGYSINDLKTKLSEKGYSRKEIDEAIGKRKTSKAIIIIFGIFILILLSYFIYNAVETSKKYQEIRTEAAGYANANNVSIDAGLGWAAPMIAAKYNDMGLCKILKTKEKIDYCRQAAEKMK